MSVTSPTLIADPVDASVVVPAAAAVVVALAESSSPPQPVSTSSNAAHTPSSIQERACGGSWRSHTGRDGIETRPFR